MSARHRQPLHLLLTDMVMPAMRGPVLAAHVVESHPDVRVVYMSGYAESMDPALWGRVRANARVGCATSHQRQQVGIRLPA
jgi:CheY-like chemotaxis protein